MTKTIATDEYRVSARVVLRPGDRFRAGAGPYWRGSDGEKIPVRARGPFVFVRHQARGAVEWIEAIDADGAACALHVAGRRRRIDVCLVTRPYKIKGKLREKSNRKALRRRRVGKVSD
jgi:hypothetical protein